MRRAMRLILGVLLLGLVFGSGAVAETNLLANPSFELLGSASDPIPGWSIVRGSLDTNVWVETGRASHGEYALILDTQGATQATVRSEPIKAAAGSELVASAKVLAPFGSRPAIYLDFWNARMERVGYRVTNVLGNGAWQEVAIGREAPAGTAYVTVTLDADPDLAPGRIYIDEVTLERDLTYSVRVVPERPEALYALDESFAFLIYVDQGGVPVETGRVQWELITDALRTVDRGTAEVIDGVARVEGRLQAPGFVRLKATVMDKTGPVTNQAAVGVGADLIEPARPAPDDFDAFWAAKKSELAQVPVRADVRQVGSGVAGIVAYDVQVDALGAPVSGYLAMPADAKPGSLPAIITLQGAGVNSAWLNVATDWAREGMLSMNINAHGIPNGMPSSYYTNLANGELNNYRFQGRHSRDEWYFLGMFLRVVRAIDYITSRPEWDGKTLILYGSSQGGAQALAGAGLDERVTFFVAAVPGMADLSGFLKDRPMGWPSMVGEFTRMDPAYARQVLETLPYFDTAYFAQRTKADGIFSVGFLDPTCAPSTVYAAYNVMPNKKSIFNDVAAAHQNTPEALRVLRQAVLDHVKEMRGEE